MFTFLLTSFAISTSFVVFDKKIASDEGIVGDSVHVFYNIYNLGDKAITDLHIDDSGITRDQWEFPKSASNLRWDRLEAGQNITYAFTVKPIVSGNLRMGPSRMRYIAEGQKKIAMSSQTFWFDAKSTRSIGAKNNLLGYGITMAAGLLAILVPFMIWKLTTKDAKEIKPKNN